MILTQVEAKKWAEILKGFSEGKRYEIPLTYKQHQDGTTEVDKWAEITDFEINPIPTITTNYHAKAGEINVHLIREKFNKKDIFYYAKLYGIPVYFQPEECELFGRNKFYEFLLNMFVIPFVLTFGGDTFKVEIEHRTITRQEIKL